MTMLMSMLSIGRQQRWCSHSFIRLNKIRAATRTLQRNISLEGAKLLSYENYDGKSSLLLQNLRTITTRSVSSSSDTSMVSEPSNKPSSTTWERGAISVKNTDVTNPYLEAIRDTHDPSMHLKTIEDELKGTIGKALGKQSEKIVLFTKLMTIEYQNYLSAIQNHNNNNNNNTTTHPNVIKYAKQFNNYQKEAIKARWELIVHRQAAGFIVNNHSYVMKHYPISEPIPIPNKKMTTSSSSEEDDEIILLTSSEENDDNNSKLIKKQVNQKKKKKKIFGDQLDWWERIGRWK